MATDLDTRVTAIEKKLAVIGATLDGTMPLPIAPSDLLNLTNWKLTTSQLDATTGSAHEVLQPDLTGYSDSWFCANPAGNGVRLRVFHGADGVTPHSLNPREELREMNGKALAAWNPTSGVHLLSVLSAVTHQTTVKPHNVLGQIHDGANDICVFRLEGTTLYRTLGNDSHNAVITRNYVLGQPLPLSFLVSAGKIRTFYGGGAANVPDLPVPSGANGWYFRAGNYLQSNSQTAPSESPDAYSDVIMYDLAVFHG